MCLFGSKTPTNASTDATTRDFTISTKHLAVPPHMMTISVMTDVSADAVWSSCARKVYYDLPLNDAGAKERLVYLKRKDREAFEEVQALGIACHAPPHTP